MYRIAFDIGGTFTDFVLASANASPRFLKLPTTPDDPARAVEDGLNQLLAEAGATGRDLEAALHATTIATNAIIERKGASTALITTAGFRDVLIIGRQKRYETYDLYMEKPPPLAPRRAIFEVQERMDFSGAVLEPIEANTVDLAIDAILAGDYQSVAVALLHGYANPDHERAIRDRLRERAPHLPVTLAAELSPKFREYERTSTAVANAYVRPIVEQYVERLERVLAGVGFERSMFIMQSAGGLISPEIAREEPVRIVESGPAAGVLMAAMIGKEAGADHVITFDMGGTTAKLGAVDGGEPAVTQTFEVDPIRYRPGSGLPINVPAVELLEIGAGGGSIARADLGVIHVGPESAGAEPGPICYGRGGDRATVTDANLVLGYLNPGFFNAGAMQLDLEEARAGIARDIAEPLGLSIEEAAWGVHTVANGNMERAMRIVSVERGRDPRRYAIVAFGGAGPAHAARIAKSIGAQQVIVPFGAGVGSAIGLLQAAPKVEASVTSVLALERTDAAAVIQSIYQNLEIRAKADLAKLGAAGEPKWSRYGYLRYRGQGYEIRADIPEGPIDGNFPGTVGRAFNAAYVTAYGYHDASAEIEAVDWHLVATLPHPTGVLDLGWQAPSTSGAATTRMTWQPEVGSFVETPIYDRRHLAADTTIEGPAVIEDPEATIVVPTGAVARVTQQGHLSIKIQQGDSV
jgi:N-methylhydantoinase A